jgi:hypothetical protein
MPPPPLRLVRAATFAVVCVSLTLLAHVMAAREPVPRWTVVAGFAAVFGVAAVLAEHERSLATILVGLLGGQFGLHAWFAAVQRPAAAGVVAGLGHAVHAETAAASAGAVPHASMGQSALAMMVAHVAAATVSAWWLWKGERAAWWLARWLTALAGWRARSLLGLPALMAPAVQPARIRPGGGPTPRPSCAVLRHTVVLRGPPPLSPV